MVADHLIPSAKPSLEIWTLLSALAMETKSLRLGSLVVCNEFRYPSIVAKMAATLDVISQGRLEFGIGAGWNEEEFAAYGIPFPKAAVRISRLKEAVQIIKKMWTEEKPSFQGKHYTVKNAICNPKPVQKPHPPIWIGGRGEQLLLKAVAELADGSNFSGTFEDFKRRFESLETHCQTFKRDPKEIQRSRSGFVIIAKTENEVRERSQSYARQIQGMYTNRPMYSQESPLSRGIVGTPEQCVEIIRRFVDIGVTYFIPKFPDLIHSEECLRLFAEKVIPEFR
jgi:F420-dependent oxidoreductase-like protein